MTDIECVGSPSSIIEAIRFTRVPNQCEHGGHHDLWGIEFPSRRYLNERTDEREGQYRPECPVHGETTHQPFHQDNVNGIVDIVDERGMP